MIAGSQANARELLRPTRTFILEEPLLLEDFPEAIYPLRGLENSSKRQLQQHIQGRLTHVHWGQDKMVFPSIEGEHLPRALREDGFEVSPSAGSIISTTSLDSNLRGQQHTRPDRSIIRPSLVLLDDPQTRESAMSADQTRKRLNLIHGDVMGLAGPGESISALMTCTVMYEGDLADTLLDREKSPEWESERTKLIYAWPVDTKSWDQYAEIRRTKGREAANAYYAAHREVMDRGASVGWPDRFDAKAGEISAIQHAFNLRLKTGPDGFATEYQNEPTLVQTADSMLSVDQVVAKVSGHKRGEIPAACTKLTMFVDVHDSLLYYMVCAWAEDFSGQIVEYGTLPQQNRSFFTRNDSLHTLGQLFPGRGVEGAIHAGLEKVVTEYLAKEWSRGGALMRLDRLLVDSGYKPGIVADVKRRCGGAVMMLSKGVGIRATRRPFAAYTKRPGETIGDHWYVPNVYPELAALKRPSGVAHASASALANASVVVNVSAGVDVLEGVIPAVPHQWFWDGREHIDPGKEASAQATRLANNTTTLATEYAKQGKDWETELRQRAREVALCRELGLTLPLALSAPPSPSQQPAPTPDDDDADKPENEEKDENGSKQSE